MSLKNKQPRLLWHGFNGCLFLGAGVKVSDPQQWLCYSFRMMKTVTITKQYVGSTR